MEQAILTTMGQRMRRPSVILFFGGLILLAIGSLRAVEYTFSGTLLNSNWSSGTDWDVTPVSDVATDLILGNGALIGEAVVMTSVQDIANPFLLNSLRFNYAGGLTGDRGTVTLQGGVLKFVNDGTNGPSLDLSATGTTGTNLDTRPLLFIENAVELDSTLEVLGTSMGWIAGDVSGSGGINKIGTSRLILSGNNSFTGDVMISVSGSVLEVRSNTALGSTSGVTRVSGNGQLALRDGVTITGETLYLRGDGGSTSASQGALRNLSGTNTWEGTINVDSTVVTRIVSSSGTLILSGPVVTVGDQTNGLVFQGEGDIRVTGSITGNAKVTKSTNGSGTLFLSGDNGTDDPGASQTLGIMTVSNGEVVFEKRQAYYYKVAGVEKAIWSGSSLSVSAGRAIGFNVGGADEFTADDIAAVNSAAAASGIGNNVELWLYTSNAIGNVFTYGNELKDWGAGRALALNKKGSNTLVLTQANSYTGKTTVDAGILRITNALALGTTAGVTEVKNGATLELSGGIIVNGEELLLTGEGVSNNGSFRSSGGHNVWNGNIKLDASRITRVAVANAADSLTINGNIETTGTNFNGLVVQGSGTTRINGDITGTGSFTRSSNGTGLVVLAGNNTYTGGTIVSSGTLQVGVGGVGGIFNTSNVSLGGGTLAGTGEVGGLVTVSSSSRLSPGDDGGAGAGTLTLDGGLMLSSTGGASIRFDLGISSDLILITGGTFESNSSGLTTFQFVTDAGFGNGSYDLIDWSAVGPLGGVGVDVSDFTYTGLSGVTASFNITDTGVLQLIVVPEPSRAVLVMCGLALVMSIRRKRSMAT